MLTKEDVKWAYNFYLERDPESETVIEHHIMGNLNMEMLVQRMIDSPEYQKKAGHLLPGSTDLNDLICKKIKFNLDANADPLILLPMMFYDPVVKAYVDGQSPNSYMLQILMETTYHGDLVMDIGCHVGTFSIGAAAMGRRVIAVDANPFHTELVSMSARLNGFSNIHVVNRAVSLSTDPVRFIPNNLFGAIDFSGNSDGIITVETLRLDEVVALHSEGRRVRFIKMDIEGAEYEALVSAERLLEEDAPILWWESNGRTLKLAGRSIFDIRTLLESKGYKTFRIEGDKWVYVQPEQIQPEEAVDVLSISEREQERCANRISWEWPEEEIVERCRTWLNRPDRDRHTLTHLLKEIEEYGPTGHLSEIAEQARRLLL
jgi:FkbM family methyltransferase